jgi:hypothetical protein
VAELFKVGGVYPSSDTAVLERIAKYERGKKFFEGRQAELYQRAAEVLKNSPHAKYMNTLYIAVNLQDILLTKPADLMFGEPPVYDVGQPDESETKKALNKIVERNRLNKMGHELVIGGGYRGDSWIKVRYGTREDFSEVPLELLGGVAPEDFFDVEMEPIIETVPAKYVFPEESSRDKNKFKAINIAFIEWQIEGGREVPYLFVERHVPGFIMYSRFSVSEIGPEVHDDVTIPMYRIKERVPTGMEEDIIATGLNYIPVWHIPYKSTDESWEGISGIEKVESIIQAINDRLVQIDYILWKHGDPPSYGPRITESDGNVSLAGRYFPLDSKDQPQPGYMQFDSRLEGQFKELDYLINVLYQMAETPQWLFGTTITENSGGTGTSHTDGVAIQARFMPILSKVKRIRIHVDHAFKHALKAALELKALNEAADIEPELPTIQWKDGIPKNKKEEAEIMAIRTGDKPTLDVKSAIKRQDEVEDDVAEDIMKRIAEDEESLVPQVTPSFPLEEAPQGEHDHEEGVDEGEVAEGGEE